MKSRLTTVSLVLGLSVFGVGGAYAGAADLGIVHGQSHAHHGTALSHGKKQGRKHHGKSLCAPSKKHGRKHHGKAGKAGKTLCRGKKHGLKHAPSVASVDSSRSSAVAQYGTRPGKGCGDQNHVHTGPPGNPSNTECPPQSQHD